MNERTKIILFGAAVGLVLLLAGGAEYYFIYASEIQRLRKENKELKSDVRDREDKKAQIGGLKEKKQNLLENEEKYRKQLPTTEEVEPQNFISNLDTIAKKAGVFPQSYGLVEDRRGQRAGTARTATRGYETTNYAISVRGEVYPLFSYIWALENQERMIDVKSFSLEVEEKEVEVKNKEEEQEENRETEASESSGSQEEEPETRTVYMGNMELEITIYSYKPPEGMNR